MKPNERKQFFQDNREKLTRQQMADVLQVGIPTVRNYERQFGLCTEVSVAEVEPETLVKAERRTRKLEEADKESKKKLKYLEAENERLENELQSVFTLQNGLVHNVIPHQRSKKNSEATAVVLLSDFHLEERVNAEQISGLNEYNLDIARSRIQRVFVNIPKLLMKEGKTAKINHLVVYLLGDYISNDIHEELMENTELLPIDAILEAQNLIVSGLLYLLEHTGCNIKVICHSGNHARTTKDKRHATEAGHSLEYFMFRNLADHFRDDERITFTVPRGYHAYLDIHGFKIRSHHGHDLRYGGGVGGIFIPAYKAIAQWNKGKSVDLDVFAHFHQRKDGGNFLCNGSVIGYNEYALSIKADYERPAQTFFLVDHKRRIKTTVSPIFTD